MWLSRIASERSRQSAAAVAQVTMGGSQTGVMTESEERNVPLFSPGGYIWRPSAGESLLVVKCGNEICAAGKESEEPPEDFAEGEVYIKSKGGASIWLKNSGDVVITGNVYIEGGLSVNGDEIT